MMKAGVAYSDWRLMARFQRNDLMARRTIELSEMSKRMEKADGASGVLALVIGKVLGF